MRVLLIEDDPGVAGFVKKGLREKAATNASGTGLAVMVYGPDYDRAMWEQQLYEEEAARKGCEAPLPVN